MGTCLLWILIVCLSFFPSVHSWGETQAYFSSQESVENKMERLIDDSRSAIDVAMFEFRSPALTRALKQAEARGVTIRLVLDTSHHQEDLPAGNVRWLGGRHPGEHGVMHNKFALFDQTQVVTGSYNWTPGAEHSNYENALLTDDKEAVKSYNDEFERLWRRASTSPHANSWDHSSGNRRRSSGFGSKKASRHTRSKSVKIRVLRLAPPRL